MLCRMVTRKMYWCNLKIGVVHYDSEITMLEKTIEFAGELLLAFSSLVSLYVITKVIGL